MRVQVGRRGFRARWEDEDKDGDEDAQQHQTTR